VAEYAEDESRPCRQVLKAAVVTPREQMTAEQKKILDFLAT
jgi:hypothetical protein